MKHVGVIAACPFLVDRGTPLRIHGLCRGLARRGHRVTVVSYHLGRDVPDDNITVKRIPSLPFYQKTDAGPSPWKPLLDSLLLVRTYQVFKQNGVDIIIGSHIEGGFIAALLKKALHVPALFDAHGSFAGEMKAFGYLGESSLLEQLYESIETFVLMSVDGTGTVSERLRTNFRRRCPRTPANVVPNGVSLEDYGATTSVREEYNIPHDDFLITYAGNLQSYQGIDCLLEALADLDREDVHLLIVGGPDEGRYRKRARKLGIEARVTFTGRVQADRIPDFLSSSDLLVAPRLGLNTQHQQASKLIQYMAAGKPILATDIPPHDVLVDGETGLLVEDDSPQALRDAVEKLLDDPDLRNRLGTSARDEAQAYSWESVTGNLLALLENSR